MPVDFQANMIEATFFDRSHVKAMMDRNTEKILGKAAFAVRRNAMRSLRRATGSKKDPQGLRPSKPGKPPKHRMPGDLGLRRILYGFVSDADTQGVIIGVRRLNTQTYGGLTVPRLHEFGGRVQKTRYRLFGKTTPWYPAKARYNPEYAKHVQVINGTARFPPRPYMRPAMFKYVKSNTFLRLFKDRIVRAGG